MTRQDADVQPAGEALALMKEATEEMAAASRELQEGTAPFWTVSTRYRRAEMALRQAALLCREAALGVWPLPVMERGERGEVVRLFPRVDNRGR